MVLNSVSENLSHKFDYFFATWRSNARAAWSAERVNWMEYDVAKATKVPIGTVYDQK